MGTNLDAGGRLAGPQDDRDGAGGLRVIDMDRQKAALVVMGVEQRQLLVTMRHIAGVVDVQRDPRRRLRIGGHPLIEERVCETDHVAQARRIFEPRQRRL